MKKTLFQKPKVYHSFFKLFLSPSHLIIVKQNWTQKVWSFHVRTTSRSMEPSPCHWMINGRSLESTASHELPFLDSPLMKVKLRKTQNIFANYTLRQCWNQGSIKGENKFGSEKVVWSQKSCVNMTVELVIQDVVDHSKPIEGHSFTVGWLLDSLRKNDKTYSKLHGNRAVKDVSYRLWERSFWSDPHPDKTKSRKFWECFRD